MCLNRYAVWSLELKSRNIKKKFKVKNILNLNLSCGWSNGSLDVKCYVI